MQLTVEVFPVIHYGEYRNCKWCRYDEECRCDWSDQQLATEQANDEITYRTPRAACGFRARDCTARWKAHVGS